MLRMLEFLIQAKLANDEDNVDPMKMKRHPGLALVVQTAHHCHKVLADAHLCHVIIGGLAVYFHGDTDYRDQARVRVAERIRKRLQVKASR
jgi:hypothetical protein